MVYERSLIAEEGHNLKVADEITKSFFFFVLVAVLSYFWFWYGSSIRYNSL